jgi:hypothetical protein
VILQNIRIAFSDRRAEALDDGGFVGRRWSLKQRLETLIVADGDQENATLAGIERGGFQVELEAVNVFISQPTKVGSARQHQILLDRPNKVVIPVEVMQTGDRATKVASGAAQQRLLQLFARAARKEKAEGAERPVQFAVAEPTGILAGGRRLLKG